jgi:hypothetical protein
MYLIRNDSGVHFEGLYGSKALRTDTIQNKLQDEKDLLLYKSLYEQQATDAGADMGIGLNIVNGSSPNKDTAKDFFDTYTDDVILAAVNKYSASGTGHDKVTDP